MTFIKHLAGLLTAFAIASPASGGSEPATGETRVKLSGALTLGSAWRGEDRDGSLLANANSALIGVAGSSPAGRNQDDGNLNFARGDALSTVIKGYADLDVRREDLGLVTRIKFWHDFVLAERAMPWGHYANGYAAGQPLGQAGFPLRSRFSGLALEDAYLEGHFRPRDMPLHVRLGRQTLPWGKGFAIGGGMSELNPVDGPASRRPGALMEEKLVAFPAVFARLEVSKEASLEAFSQIGFEPNVLVPCGTFYSILDYAAPGCDRLWVGGTNDRNPVGFRTRAPGPETANTGQFGLAFHYRLNPATLVTMSAARYHSRMPFGSMIKGALPTSTQYYTEHPEHLRAFALQFTSKWGDTTFQGALTHRPNQPVQLNGADLILAFATPNAALLRAEANATAAGAAYLGYDRLRTSQLQLAANRDFRALLGAASVTLGGEIAVKQIHDLPDVTLRRYGRSEAFGAGPIPGTACAGSAISCASAGFVSPSSWGYRLQARLNYPDMIQGVTLKPAFAWGHDVRGWSADNVFIEGRKSTTLSLRADFGRRYFSELAWQETWGGNYDNTRDRDTLSLVMGTAF